MDDQLREAVQYFKSKKGFDRLFTAFVSKYQRVGKLSGTVKVDNLTPEERESFSAFFGSEILTSIRITFRRFEETLNKTKFTGVDILELLAAYFEKEILTNEEQADLKRQEKEAFIDQLADQFSCQYCRLWLDYLRIKNARTKAIHQAFDKDQDHLKQQLEHILKAISVLTEKKGVVNQQKTYVRLPFFANQITKDPHGFDIDTEQGRMLISALQWMREQEDNLYQYKSNLTTEQIAELFHYYGLIRDDLLNFVTCSGIIGFFEASDTPIPMLKSAYEDKHILNLPVRELIRYKRSMPAPFYYDSSCPNVVFAVENSGVFSTIIDQWPYEQLPPLICSQGHIKLATLVLMEQLAANGTTIYYSGDFDPDGLQIAQKLKNRFPENIKLWHYSEEDYHRSMSDRPISYQRLNYLESITIEDLQSVKEKMQKKQKAGYQENLINLLIKDMKEIYQCMTDHS